MKKVYANPLPLKDDFGISLAGWKHYIAWCKQQWPNKDYDLMHAGDGWKYIGQGVFEFERDEDATLFLLRWS